MANRKGKKSTTKADYIQAIRFYGGKASKNKTKKQLQQTWSDIRKEHRKAGENLPRIDKAVQQAKQAIQEENERAFAKQIEDTLKAEQSEEKFDYEFTDRDENMNTEPPEDAISMGADFIERFIQTIQDIYNDTKNEIDTLPSNSKQQYFMKASEDKLDGELQQILMMIDSMRAQFSDDIVAQALSEDVELDYTIALVYIPPSGVKDNFETTIEQLEGIMINISAGFYAYP